MTCRRLTTVATFAALLVTAVAGCAGSTDVADNGSAPLGEQTSAESETSTDENSTDETTTTLAPESEPCSDAPITPDQIELPEETEQELVDISSAVFPCADSVVLVSNSTPWMYAEAASTALSVGAPLLLYENNELGDGLRAELDRLAPTRIRVYGDLPATEIGELPVVSVLRTEDSDFSPGNLDQQLAEVLQVTRDRADVSHVLLIGRDDRRAAIVSAPMMAAAGAITLAVDPSDPETLRALLPYADADVAVTSATPLSPTDQWRVDVALAGTELPGGGTELFPDRRLVAFYGSPVTHRLGVLGEQDVAGTLERLVPIAESYATAQHPLVIPAFEIIATVADGVPGGDGDYSRELAADDIREWVEFAGEEEMFVLIDLQPGRSDFLSQAKLYEDFIRLPHVGLALDPEWRLRPDELPLTRIGSVEADEVNAVIEWMTEIVREDALPQKPLVLHQFLPRMLTDRETIATPDEIAVIVHVDGQGSLASKFGTYRTITEWPQAPNQTIWWGWKNFYDEDFPVATPERVNEVDPLPMVITYQ